MKSYFSGIYAICCTSRTGSSWLCDLLKSTGCMGKPGEYLNRPNPSSDRSHGEASIEVYLDTLLQGCGQPFLGIKGSLSHIRVAIDYFPDVKCIYLRRRDKMLQAISYYRADCSKIWMSRTQDQGQPVPEFRPEKILAIRRTFIKRDQEWESYFNSKGVQPFNLWYEDILLDCESAVLGIAGFLGVKLQDTTGLNLCSTMRIQRDDTTAQWAE